VETLAADFFVVRRRVSDGRGADGADGGEFEERAAFFACGGEVDAEFEFPVVEIVWVDEGLADPPCGAVLGEVGAGVAAVACFGVETDAFVGFVERVDGSAEAVRAPCFAWGCGEDGSGGGVVAGGEGAEEAEDFGADEGGEFAWVSGDVRFLRRGWCQGGGGCGGGWVAEPFPFVEETGVGAADDACEPCFHFVDGGGFERGWDGLGEDLEDGGEVSEENAFDAVEVVVFDVVSEAAEVFEHFAGDAFGADVFRADPWVEIGERVESAVDEIAAGFGVFEVFESGETLFEGDPVGFHLLHGLGFGLGELAAEDDVRVFGDGFAEREDVGGESGGVGVEEGEGIDEIE